MISTIDNSKRTSKNFIKGWQIRGTTFEEKRDKEAHSLTFEGFKERAKLLRRTQNSFSKC